MKIKEIIQATKGKLIQGDEEKEIQEFCKDTRTIKKGDTYIGIKGENFDGNTLWKKAFESGAEAVIIQGIDFSKENLEQNGYTIPYGETPLDNEIVGENVYLNIINQAQKYGYTVSQDELKQARLEMLYNIPSGFELTAAMTTNYRQLKTIYQQRRHHPLPDWQVFCDFCESLPMFMELTQKNYKNNT